MNTQPILYARAPDEHPIAYWQGGSGPELLTSGIGLTGAGHDFEVPVIAEFYRRLFKHFHVTRLDERPFVGIEGAANDILAVARAAGLQRFALLSVWPGPTMRSVFFAHQHPEMLSQLVLWSPGLDAPESLNALSQLEREHPEFGSELRLFRGGFDEETRDWVKRHQKDRLRSPSQMWPQEMATLAEMGELVGPLLSQIELPVLTMYRRDALADYGEVTRAFAAEIPGAVVVPVEGSGTAMVVDEQEAIVEMIASFAGDPSAPSDESTEQRTRRDESAASLTSRELEVVRLLPGRSNARIAGELGISESTVANHVRNILAKTDTADRTEALDYAHRHGLLGS